MQQPLISVVIPTRNRLEFLKEAIASVKNQTFKDWELIIVDDASEDGTWEWLKSIENNLIHTFRLDRQSFSSIARNKGINEALGKFVMFLDDDDRLRSNALEILMKPMLRNQELIACVGARWKFKEGVYALRIEHPRRSIKRIIWPDLLGGWSSVSGQNLYRLEAVRTVGGYKPELHRAQDRDLWLRVARLGSVILLPAITVEYRVHPGQSLPQNIVEIRESIFNEFINNLPVEEQPRGKRIRESANCSQKAEDEYRKGNYKEALSCYIKACQAAPELVVSPLTGLPLVRGVAKSLVRSLLPK